MESLAGSNEGVIPLAGVFGHVFLVLHGLDYTEVCVSCNIYGPMKRQGVPHRTFLM